MDLNELPPDFDYDFLDESEANPSYCTQIVPCGGAKTVHDTEHAAVSNNEGPNGDGIGAIGNNIAEDAPTMDVSNDEGPNGDDIGAVGNNITEDAPTMIDNTQDVAVPQDIWSTLPVPSRRQERFTTHMQEELDSQFVQVLRGYLVQQENKRR